MIATGSAPSKPAFEGAELCWSSDDIFTMEKLPKSIIAIGGGYIGMELSQILNTFGVKMTVVEKFTPLRLSDAEVRNVLLEEMQRTGIDIKLDLGFSKVTKEANGLLKVHLEDGSYLEGERILLSMGRPPNLEGLGLENTNVKIEDKRRIWVDEY